MRGALWYCIAAALWALPAPALADADTDCRFPSVKKPNRVETACSELIAADPTLAWAFNNRGFGYYRTGTYDAALGDFERAIAINSSHPVPYNNRGLVHGARCELDEALADFNKAIQLEPNFAEAVVNRNSVYSERGEKPPGTIAVSPWSDANYHAGFLRDLHCKAMSVEELTHALLTACKALLIGAGIGLAAGIIFRRRWRERLSDMAFAAGGSLVAFVFLNLDMLLNVSLTYAPELRAAFHAYLFDLGILDQLDSLTRSVPYLSSLSGNLESVAGALFGLLCAWLSPYLYILPVRVASAYQIPGE